MQIINFYLKKKERKASKHVQLACLEASFLIKY